MFLNMEKDIKTLVLSGASTNGVVSLGAVQYIWDTHTYENIVNYVGTSSGSIICALLCVDYTPIEILAKLCTKDVYSKIQVNLAAFISEGSGVFSFDKIDETIRELFIEKVGYIPTILDLWEKFGKNFSCTTLNLKTEEKVYITKETHPYLLVTDAVHMSSCFPVIFKPFILNDCEYIDGGICDNFPVRYSSKFSGYGIGICIASPPNKITHPYLPYAVGHLLYLLKIHNNIIARDQAIIPNRDCYFIRNVKPSFFDFSCDSNKLVNLFYQGYDEFEKVFHIEENPCQ